jgi:hypothetical protein
MLETLHEYATERLETQTLALDALARAAVANGDTRRAAQLLQEADGLHAHVRHALDDADRIDARAVRAALPGAVDRGARPTVP